MEPKIRKILHIYEDMSVENKDTIVSEDFDKYSVGESMLLIYHQHSGVWGEHLQNTLHVHNFYEIEFVYGGKGIHLLGNSSFQIARGCAYLRTPNNLHTTWQDKDDVIQSYKIQFTGDFIPKEMLTSLLVESNALCVRFDEEELSQIVRIINRIRREMQEQKPYYTVLMVNLFQEILVLFNRKYQAVRQEPSPYSSHVTEALRFINDNFRGEIFVQELADRLHLSAHYLGDLFRKEIGKNILEYTGELRLQLARQLLLHTEMGIGDIAVESGYKSAAYFISRFRKRFGISPLQFRVQSPKM